MQLCARPPPFASPAPLLLAAVIILGLAPPAATAEPVVLAGAVAVIDGDTFRIGETVVRLYDIDAPEIAQTCDGGSSPLRHCGAHVADALAEHLAGREVRCDVLKLDQYDRRVARCEVDGEGLSEWLVASGLAMVFRRYSDRFTDEEEAARAAGIGLWQTEFTRRTARNGTRGRGSTRPKASAGFAMSAKPWMPAGARPYGSPRIPKIAVGTFTATPSRMRPGPGCSRPGMRHPPPLLLGSIRQDSRCLTDSALG
jgi:endonuclease YncB( thermonuclease family)